MSLMGKNAARLVPARPSTLRETISFIKAIQSGEILYRLWLYFYGFNMAIVAGLLYAVFGRLLVRAALMSGLTLVAVQIGRRQTSWSIHSYLSLNRA